MLIALYIVTHKAPIIAVLDGGCLLFGFLIIAVGILATLCWSVFTYLYLTLDIPLSVQKTIVDFLQELWLIYRNPGESR
jgi:hypothetical protein